ncbi:TetR/AcrR family transcriptional regulator [Streptomyces sp. HUAS ZL42]|uniref:TetR/AcrR family transcriptional regulator n=1 Tax=Streptomyces sp. HUAS ZL42 TaxID=3231715 RepID=UPI00345ED301
MARTPAPGTRGRILGTAAKLFSERGVRAVGMQQVIEATGVGKSLLYREFASKDELVAAWIRQSDEEWWEQARRVTQPHAGDPVRQIMALMDFFYDSVGDPGFRGCIYFNTSSEFRDPEHPGRREARQHLEKVRAWLRDLGAQAGSHDPEAMADALMLVIGGMLANGEVMGAAGPARVAAATAEAIIGLYCPDSVSSAAA